MKQEINVLTKNVAELREDVEILRESNIETAYKITLLEEEFESDYDCEEENLHNESIEKNNLKKCKKYGFEETDCKDDDKELGNVSEHSEHDCTESDYCEEDEL